MSIQKPVAIVLGGTNPHRALISSLKERGYYVTLIDYLENPPAKALADLHIQESTLDKKKVLEIAKKMKVSLVISSCVDQAYVTACYVGEELGLSIPFSYQTSRTTSEKITMKQTMLKNRIPTANFVVTDDSKNPNLEDLNYPLVVKPSDTNGSKGVRKVDSKDLLEKSIKEALLVSRNKKIIAEEFMEGIEIGVDCIISNHKAYIITTHQKRKPNINTDNSVIFSIGSLSPAQLSEKAIENVKFIANRIAHVFKLNNTPLLIQFIVNHNDVKVIEFAPRIGGGLNFFKIKQFAAYDIINASIDSFLNIPIKTNFSIPNCFYSENHIYTEPGIFGEIIGSNDLIKNETIEILFPNKTRGMSIEPGKASKERAASFIVKGQTIKEIEDKVKRALDVIKVKDINGHELSFKQNYKELLFH